MRKEIQNWWDQAKYDFDSAKDNLKIKRYNLVVFLCQQALEKGLKALIQKKKRTPNIVSHSLIFLGKEAGVPEKHFSFLRRVSPQYILTRYPDAAEEAPYKLFDEEIAKEFLSKTEEIIKWIENQIE